METGDCMQAIMMSIFLATLHSSIYVTFVDFLIAILICISTALKLPFFIAVTVQI